MINVDINGKTAGKRHDMYMYVDGALLITTVVIKIQLIDFVQAGLVENFIESVEYDKLRKSFKRLDTDMDG